MSMDSAPSSMSSYNKGNLNFVLNHANNASNDKSNDKRRTFVTEKVVDCRYSFFFTSEFIYQIYEPSLSNEQFPDIHLQNKIHLFELRNSLGAPMFIWKEIIYCFFDITLTSTATLLKISHTLAKKLRTWVKFSMWPQKIVIQDEIWKQKIFNHRSRIITDLTNMIATVDMAYTQYGKGNLHHSVEFKSCKILLELLKETEHTAAIHWRIVAPPVDFDKLYEDEASSMQVNLTSADLEMLRTQSVRNTELDSLADELSVEPLAKKARHCKNVAKTESPEIAPPKIEQQPEPPKIEPPTIEPPTIEPSKIASPKPEPEAWPFLGNIERPEQGEVWLQSIQTAFQKPSISDSVSDSVSEPSQEEAPDDFFTSFFSDF